MDLEQELAQNVEDLWIVRFTAVATLAVLVYEYIITVDDEIKHMWSPKLTLGRVLYFMNRYLPFISTVINVNIFVVNTTPSSCRPEYLVAGAVAFIEFLTAVFVLFTRAYAVWAQNRAMLAILIICYAFTIGGSGYVTSRYLMGASTLNMKLLPTGCIYVFNNRIVWIALVNLIACESVALSLLLMKAVRHFRYTSSNLMVVMTRDGIGYFVCNIAITITNLIVLKRVSPVLCNFLLVTQGVLQNILCNRLLIHIRTAGGNNQDESLQPQSFPYSSGDRIVIHMQTHSVLS
ncbi:hypothetical protein SCHPADRAFT_937268 [Schizopora paradoxa]|uniref:DUF6533 domain-containing protein n=1 Tax=Schizopora paradoxa TaxID=27342 RepID=A0A0H2SJE5_9AGAM|nr:hypothetical protein SCHPADRAFT_937268 [Schizopora paradoxa]